MPDTRTSSVPISQNIIQRDRESLSPSYKREYPLVVDHAQGSELWDVDGKRYIDFMAGVAVLNVGHRHPHVVERVQQQMDLFWHICLSDFYYPQAVELAEKLQAISPMDDTLIYFGNTGTEAVEAAIKLAMYHTNRRRFIGFLGGFHGRTLGSLSFTASKTVQRARYPSGVKVHHVPFPDPYRPIIAAHDGQDYGDAVADFIENELFRTLVAPHDVAGILIEPIQGEGGYIVPAEGFLSRLRQICNQYGILLIVDEIQSGIARTGKWWAIEHENVEPDIVCFAKGVGSGLPIGGIIARKSLMTWKPGSHGSTFGGNPLAIAAALATLEVIEKENLLSQSKVKGNFILDALAELQVRHPNIGHIRGRGLMIGMEFVKNKTSKARAKKFRDRFIQSAFERGLLMLPCGENAVRVTPPLNISQELINEGLLVIDRVLTDCERAQTIT